MAVLSVALLVVLYTFQSLFQKLFSTHYESSSAALTSTIFSISYGAFAGIATLAVTGLSFAPSPATWICGLVNALALWTYNMSMIKASRTGSYSFQMIAMLFGGIVLPMVFNAIFLGTALSALQLFAIALMLVSFVLMNLKGLSLKGSSGVFLTWCLILFVANGVYGILMNLQQHLSAGAERNEMIVLTYLGMAVLCAAVQLCRDPKALIQGFRIPAKPLLFLLLCCACATLASHLLLYCLTLVDASILYTIDNGGVLVLSVLLSCLLFREKLSRAQLTGIALSVISIVLLSL